MATGQSISKNFEFNTITEFTGYNSSYDPTKIVPNFLVEGSQNVYKKRNGNIAVRDGLQRRGSANSALAGVKSAFIWNTSWGTTLPMWVADGNLQVEYNLVWYTLASGITDTRYVFDNWWDNTEKKDRVLMVNGNDSIQHWSGGITPATAQSIGGSTLTKQGTTTWSQVGFSVTTGEKKFKINGSGTEYTYTGGEDTTTLTGITPVLPAITEGDIIIQSVLTESTSPAVGFSNDFIKVINNQLYVGSYTSRLIYFSASDDWSDFVIPVPRSPGSAGLITLDGTGKGIGVREGKPHIGFGTGSWGVVSFSNSTVGTDIVEEYFVDVKPVSAGQAPYAHEFIDTVGDSLVYLAQDQQVRMFGDFTNLFTPGYPSISQSICTELEALDFTGGALKIIGEFTYLTAPNSGSVYLYQSRTSVDSTGQVVAERLWHPPFIWNATRVDVIGTDIVVFSNANPQVYYGWDTGQFYDDSPGDEQLPYDAVAAFAYRSNNRRQGVLEFDKVFTEGYIYGGTNLNLTVNYDYQGASNQIISVVNSPAMPVFTFSQQIASLGDASLGDESLGDQLTETTTPKFKCINSVGLNDCFEYQLIYSSDTANSFWELSAVGANARMSDTDQANFIINKLR